MVILDTNIIIDHLRLQKSNQKSHLVKLAEKQPSKETLALSVISIQEFYIGQSTKRDIPEQILLATISPLKIFSYTYEVAQLAGEIARDLNRTISFADAAIASSAILYHCTLFTLNKKDFEGIKGLEFV